MQNRTLSILVIYIVAFIGVYLYFGSTGNGLWYAVCAAILTVPLVFLLRKRLQPANEQPEALPTSFESEFRLAEKFILDRRLDDARRILAKIDHPKAREWEAGLDDMTARKKRA